MVPEDRKRGRSRIEVLFEERWRLAKIGVSPLDWRKLTRWERHDLLYRHGRDCAALVKMVEKGNKEGHKLAGLLQAVVGKILGIH